MKSTGAEPYRDIDFSRAKRGAVVKSEPGKTKISIRLDNAVLEDRKSTRLNSSHSDRSRMPSSA